MSRQIFFRKKDVRSTGNLTGKNYLFWLVAAEARIFRNTSVEMSRSAMNQNIFSCLTKTIQSAKG